MKFASILGFISQNSFVTKQIKTTGKRGFYLKMKQWKFKYTIAE